MNATAKAADDPFLGEQVVPLTRAHAITFSPGSLLIACLFIQGWLVILHVHLANHPNPGVALLGQAFDLTRESSVPTCWSTLQAFAVAFFAAASAVILGHRGVATNRRIGWIIAAFVFGAIAIDDAAAIHERLGSITSLELMAQLGYKSYPWHVMIAPFFAGGILLSLVLVWPYLSVVRGGRALVVAAVACYGSSQGIDYVEGLERMAKLPTDSLSRFLPTWMALEEVLEMVGTSLFLCAFALCFERCLKQGTDTGTSQAPAAPAPDLD